MKIGDIRIEEDKVTVKMKKLKTDVLMRKMCSPLPVKSGFLQRGFGEVNQQAYVVMLAQILHWGGYKGLN